ncbi:hypothetical protein B0H17DRAFT_1047469 [Mycena rosella]|uniref:DUF2423 domain-containing protein n=1 Tax=Mycena rosella TaxID=1033263 RepID=A0AAD7GKV6_MYCRO|nr:hypothetical protein B0H17DRAFT_1047469 [Mycena rosella]
MAKSTRSKVKRSFRASKRETGIYAATEAARLNRLHAKLSAVASREGPIDAEGIEEDGEDQPADETNPDLLPEADSMAVDAESSKKISTHGPRGSRREEWRTSKGLAARPSPTGMNRQGGVAARRKAGRSKRRR